MDPQFWHERWQRGELGWHRDEVNPLLERHWPRLALDTETAVFVPLCGKSRDLLWLAELGHPVTGVELSPIGTEEFFQENILVPSIADDPPFRRYHAGSIEILCGDVFDLEPQHLSPIGAIYDRGALVALKPELRERYVVHLQALLPRSWTALVITFDYPQPEMEGPPFSVGSQDVERYFGASHRIERLAVCDALVTNPVFRERGLTKMDEMVFALRPRHSSPEPQRRMPRQ